MEEYRGQGYDDAATVSGMYKEQFAEQIHLKMLFFYFSVEFQSQLKNLSIKPI